MNGAAGTLGLPTAQGVNMGQDLNPEPEAPGAAPATPPLPHDFSHSIIQHHDDGSHTVHHVNRKHGHAHVQPHKPGDVRSGVAGHDEMLDHVMDNTGMEE